MSSPGIYSVAQADYIKKSRRHTGVNLVSSRRKLKETPQSDTALEVESFVRRIAELCDESKALQVLVLDLRGRSGYAEFLVIASGTSDRHVQAIAEGIEEKLKAAGKRPIGTEGLSEGQWALLDYASVVVHVFHHFTRDVYNLEGLWKDAPRLTLSAPVSTHARP